MNRNTVLALLILPLFAACGGGRNTAVRDEVSGQFVEATPFKTLPEEASGILITGIGTSEKRANFTLMREAAMTSAQADLARKVQTKVESVWKRTMADWSEYREEGFSEAQSLEEMKTMQKSIVDSELRGPWQTQELIDKTSGRYWVRILYSADTVEKWTKERLKSGDVLKKYFIEAQLRKVQDDLQKDLDAVRQKEIAGREVITNLTK